MDNKKIKKYERITKITGILIGLVLILGTSYAVFKTVTRSEETNTISAGKLDVRIENEQDEILLENSYPITEKEGLKQSPYTFSIVNKGSINAEYELYIEIEENTTLPLEVVRYYLTVEEEGVEKIVTEQARIISQEEKIEREGKSLYKIDTKYIDTTKTNKYKLYLWIDYEATTEQASNKYFEAKVVVDSVQIYDKNRLVKQIDVSESGDGSVQAYMYADGTVYLKGKGTLTSGLSDTLVYEKEGIVDNYKKVLIQAGCNEEEVKAITSMKELEAYVEAQASNNENFGDEFDEALTVVIAKETLEEMGQDTSNITDMNSLMNYLMEIGYMDEEGYPTEIGEEFFTKFDEKYNTNFSTEPTPPTKIVLEDGIENIPSGLFTYNEDITEVRIPASVKRIDDRAFEGCTGLKEIIIPKSVTSIGNYAFLSCTNLTKTNYTGSIEEWVNIDFSSAQSNPIYYSKNLYINNKLVENIIIKENIKAHAFVNCESLKKVELLNQVTSIGSYAFQSCTSLTSIDIPASVTSIGYNAFDVCTGIKKLTIDGTKNYSTLGMPNVEELVITGTGNMYNYSYVQPWYLSQASINKVTISDTITSIGNSAFYNCTSLTTIDIPESVTSIGNYAFSYCTNLTTIDIPDSVTSIGYWAFYLVGNINYNGSLSGTFEARARNGYVEGDYVYTDSSKTILAAYCGKEIVVNIPASVTIIGNRAFDHCTSLTTIEIPNSVTSIGNFAFDMCTSLTTIDIPKSVTSIGNFAFYNCRSLTSITIPNSVTSIGGDAFKYCTSLTSITIPNSVSRIGNEVFYDWTSSQTINIDNTEAYVKANWSSNWKYGCNAQINYLRS